MNLSALQPAGAQDSTSALFFPASSSDGAEVALFGSLLEEELGADVFAVSSVSAKGLSSPSVSADKSSEPPPRVDAPLAAGGPLTADGPVTDNGPVTAHGPAAAGGAAIAQPKGGGHKKTQSENNGVDHTGAVAWLASLIGPVPLDPPQTVNQQSFARASSVEPRQSSEFSNASVPGAEAERTQPATRLQVGLNSSAHRVLPEKFPSMADVNLPQPPVFSQQETQASALSLPGAAPRTMPSAGSGHAMPQNFEKNEVHSPDASVMDGTASKVTQDQPGRLSDVPAQLLDARAEVNFPDAGSPAYADPTPTVDHAVAGATVAQLPPNLMRIFPQSLSSGTSSVPQSHFPVVHPVEKSAAIAHTSAPASSEVQIASHNSLDTGDHQSQLTMSVLIESQRTGEVLKFSGANGTAQSFSHHANVDQPQAGNGCQAGSENSSAMSDSGRTSVAGARNSDRNSGPTQIAGASPQQNAQTVTPAQQPVPAATSAAAGSQPVSLSVAPAASSQPPAAPPIQTAVPKPALHDVPATTPDAPAPVQVHSARMVQGDQRSEMRMGMQTEAFGALEVHASVSGRDVRLAVSAEHGDLRSCLAPEVPVLQSNLQQHDLRLEQVRTVLSGGMQQEFSPGSGREERRFSRPHHQPGAFDQPRIAASLDDEDSAGGLSIRI